MEPIVDLAPGAEQDPLAVALAAAVRSGLQSETRRRAFERLRGGVGVVVDDTATALTLRFDFGRLTVHEGLVGDPTVTLRGQRADLEGLTRLAVVSDGLGQVRDRAGREALSNLLGALRSRRLVIYGLLSHPRFVLRLLHVLSAGIAGGFDAESQES